MHIQRRNVTLKFGPPPQGVYVTEWCHTYVTLHDTCDSCGNYSNPISLAMEGERVQQTLRNELSKWVLNSLWFISDIMVHAP